MKHLEAPPRRSPLVPAALRGPLAALLSVGAVALAAGCGDDSGGGGGSTATGSGGATSTTGQGGPTGSTSTGEGAGDPCDALPVACFDAASCFADPPTGVSFQADVLPVLERSCALSNACHGNPQSPTTASGYRPYLGATGDGTSDVDLIMAAIVGVESFVDPSKSVVEPGSWETSTFMNKMDGALDDCADLDCPDGCGRLMPQGLSVPLPIAERNLVRAWIAEGAQAN